jgi:two-component system, OmpR family, sensor histidine kinase VicK
MRILNHSVSTSSPSDTIITQMTKVLEGDHNVVNTILQFVSNAKNRIDACIDSSRPSLAIEIERLKEAFLDARRRGVKLRYVTEVTEDNVAYCKDLLKIVDELRHLEDIKGNFYVNETEYIASATLHEKGKPASQITYSNVKEIVQHHKHYVFDTLWNRAIPAELRIQEIEKGDGGREGEQEAGTAEELAISNETKIIALVVMMPYPREDESL